MNDDRRDVRLEIRIDAAPETVFVLLTDPTQMQSWFAEQVEADPRPGGIFRISGPIGVSIEGPISRSCRTGKWCLLGRR